MKNIITPPTVEGAGLGLRRAMLGTLNAKSLPELDFMEVAPENWINVGGRYGQQFRAMTEALPFFAHGLSLSLGGPDPLDVELLKQIKRFLDQHNIEVYSEHLSYCSDQGQLYDLLPIPFTDEAVEHVVSRIHQVQDMLQRPLVIENVSYYAASGQQMPELEFLHSVLKKAGCGLLLDVNNIYVNSVNHGYDAHDFLEHIPGEHIVYYHVAGHFNEAEDLIVDTHGADVIDPVWDLLNRAYQLFGVRPTLLERDFNIPAMAALMGEVDQIRKIQASNGFDSTLGKVPPTTTTCQAGH